MNFNKKEILNKIKKQADALINEERKLVNDLRYKRYQIQGVALSIRNGIKLTAEDLKIINTIK